MTSVCRKELSGTELYRGRIEHLVTRADLHSYGAYGEIEVNREALGVDAYVHRVTVAWFRSPSLFFRKVGSISLSPCMT